MTALAKVGIKTLHRGVLMRSRNEARWAALFDVMGIDWEYEALDLLGYIPDFSFELGDRECIVEVKAADEDFEAAETKIECSGWEGPALIVGHRIDGSCCGRFLDFDGVEWQWGELEFIWCTGCQQVGPVQAESGWHCRHCGAREGHIGDFDVQEAWVAAGNRFQWRPQ